MDSFTARISIFGKAGIIALCGFALAFAGCNENTPKNASSTPSQPKANEFETGRFALQKMLPSAHMWAHDAEPVSLSSTATTTSNGHDGKAGFWRAVFASRSQQKSEPFSWSGMADAASSLDHGVEAHYNPDNRSMQAWDLNFLKVDTDQAFAVAQEHGGKQLLEKDPNLGVNYLLDFDPLSNQLRWHVIYGSSGAGRLTVLVNASSGLFLRKE
jgi:hypothetical protein